MVSGCGEGGQPVEPRRMAERPWTGGPWIDGPWIGMFDLFYT